LTTWLAQSGLGRPFIISSIVIELDKGAKHNGQKNKGEGGRKPNRHSTQPLQDLVIRYESREGEEESNRESTYRTQQDAAFSITKCLENGRPILCEKNKTKQETK